MRRPPWLLVGLVAVAWVLVAREGCAQPLDVPAAWARVLTSIGLEGSRLPPPAVRWAELPAGVLGAYYPLPDLVLLADADALEHELRHAAMRRSRGPAAGREESGGRAERHLPVWAGRLAADDRPDAREIRDGRVVLEQPRQRAEPLGPITVEPDGGLGVAVAGTALAGLVGLDAGPSEELDHRRDAGVERGVVRDSWRGESFGVLGMQGPPLGEDGPAAAATTAGPVSGEVSQSTTCQPFAVLSIVDGDTVDGWWEVSRIEAADVLTITLRRVRVRLEDVRAPETRGDERPAGLKAKAALAELLGSAEAVQLCDATDGTSARDGGFGRVLGSLRADGRDVGAVLVEAGLAGRGSKQGWDGAP